MGYFDYDDSDDQIGRRILTMGQYQNPEVPPPDQAPPQAPGGSEQDAPAMRTGLSAAAAGESMVPSATTARIGDQVPINGQPLPVTGFRPGGRPILDIPTTTDFNATAPQRPPLDALTQTPPVVPGPPSDPMLGDLMQRKAALTPIDRTDPMYHPSIGRRILQGVANFATGGIPGEMIGLTDPHSRGYIGPGAVNPRYSQDVARQQGQLGHLDEQIADREKLQQMNTKGFEAQVKEERARSAQERAETAQYKLGIDQQLADVKKQAENAKESGIKWNPAANPPRFEKNGQPWTPTGANAIEQGVAAELVNGIDDGPFKRAWMEKIAKSKTGGAKTPSAENQLKLEAVARKYGVPDWHNLNLDQVNEALGKGAAGEGEFGLSPNELRFLDSRIPGGRTALKTMREKEQSDRNMGMDTRQTQADIDSYDKRIQHLVGMMKGGAIPDEQAAQAEKDRALNENQQWFDQKFGEQAAKYKNTYGFLNKDANAAAQREQDVLTHLYEGNKKRIEDAYQDTVEMAKYHQARGAKPSPATAATAPTTTTAAGGPVVAAGPDQGSYAFYNPQTGQPWPTGTMVPGIDGNYEILGYNEDGTPKALLHPAAGAAPAAPPPQPRPSPATPAPPAAASAAAPAAPPVAVPAPATIKTATGKTVNVGDPVVVGGKTYKIVGINPTTNKPILGQ